jgi:glyoxylate/hydroxypyruvate reductase A
MEVGKVAILYSSAIDDPAPWKKFFAERRPDLDFRVWPEVGNPADIRYALVWSAKEGLLKSLPNLVAIFSLGAGVDQILRDREFPKHVPLFRLVDAGLKEQMSEYAIYGVLRRHRRMDLYEAQQTAHRWEMQPAVHPSERTVGVMGLGVFGSDAAVKLAGLGFRVLGWSRTPKRLANIESFAGREGLDPFLARSEILVNLLPLTAETRGILSRRLFEKLPRGAALIHLGRGAHLDEADLIAAIAEGRIGWAMLDVFPNEPLPPDHPLWSNPAVFVTPHVAAQPVSDVALGYVLSNLDRFERGEEPMGRVNPDVGY